jgi:hypothetical protein
MATLEREPITGQLIVGAVVVQEGDRWVKYSYVHGHSPDLEGIAEPVWGYSGPEMRFRRVVPHAVAIF